MFLILILLTFQNNLAEKQKQVSSLLEKINSLEKINRKNNLNQKQVKLLYLLNGQLTINFSQGFAKTKRNRWFKILY